MLVSGSVGDKNLQPWIFGLPKMEAPFVLFFVGGSFRLLGPNFEIFFFGSRFGERLIEFHAFIFIASIDLDQGKL